MTIANIEHWHTIFDEYPEKIFIGTYCFQRCECTWCPLVLVQWCILPLYHTAASTYISTNTMGYATVSMCSMAVFRGGHLWDPPLCPVSPTLHNITPALWHNGAYTTSLSENAFLHSLSSGRGGAPFTKLFLRNLSWLLLWCPPFPASLPPLVTSIIPRLFQLFSLPSSWFMAGRVKVFNFLQSSSRTHKARSEMSDSVYNW